jgi:ferrous iron transport protein B
MAAAEEAIKAAKRLRPLPMHTFSGPVEHAIAHIEEAVLHDMPSERQRWYAIKIFERDEKVLAKLGIPVDKLQHIEQDIVAAEKELDDDAESLIISERYNYIAELLKGSYHKANAGGLTTSDKIDKIVTSRILGLPILAVVMFLVYYIAMVAVGQKASEWANEGLFGDGFHLFGVGTSKYEAKLEAFTDAKHAVDAFVTKEKAADVAAKLNPAAEGFDAQVAKTALADYSATVPNDAKAVLEIVNEEDLSVENVEFTGEDLKNALLVMDQFGFTEPDPAADGWWIPGVPVVIGDMLDKMNCSKWLRGLVIGGIVAGVGAVLGFVPQIFVLFLLLAFLEACGYMSRIAFVLDRLFRKFGLSGKSFIPILVGTGCGVPGIMASRTIESERDRRMTIITTTFIPCGAKTPFIALIAGAIFGGSPWISTGAYFLGMASIIVSGIILKKTKMFAGDPAPFVMELPAYHMPTVGNVLRSMWERGWSFIKKAGTIILLSTIFVWFTTYFGFAEDGFRMLEEEEIDHSLLAKIGGGIAWIFAPLGWGNWQAAVASITGLVAKENIVGTLGILYKNGASESVYGNLHAAFTGLAGYSFLVFNLLCAPCFAAMGAIKREMNNARWTTFAIAYQCVFAYLVGLVIYQIGSALNGQIHIIGVLVAAAIVAGTLYMLFRPYREATKLTTMN